LICLFAKTYAPPPAVQFHLVSLSICEARRGRGLPTDAEGAPS
jgi:hypothetical protein